MTVKTTEAVDPVELHRCTGCGATLEVCDRKLLRRGTTCCGQCHLTDTHRNEDFDANCRRMALLSEGRGWLAAYQRSLTPTSPRYDPLAVVAPGTRRLEPLVNGIVVDPDGTRDLPHPYEPLGERVSDGFCRRCGRDSRHAFHELEFYYTNHRGETAARRVLPLRLEWGATEWHPETQWLLWAYDLDRGAERAFALSGVVHQPQLPDPAPARWTEGDVPDEAWELLDRLAGRVHSEGGSVRTAVVELLNVVRGLR